MTRRGGRPAKFSEPSRAVTVTLPVRILEQLRSLDQDRAKAIVKAVEGAAGNEERTAMQIELVEMHAGVSLLVAPSSESLRMIPWLKLIEIAPTRYLLTITSGISIEQVEVALIDLIEDVRASLPHEIPMLETLREQFAKMRRSRRIHKAEILLVVGES